MSRREIIAACVVGVAGIAGIVGASGEMNAAGVPLSPRAAASPVAPVAPFPARTRALMDRLQKVEYFAIGGTGFAGTTSNGETTMRALLKEPRALEAFAELERTATVEGRLYALLALKRLAPKRFDVLYPAYATERGDAETMSGCMMMREPIKNVAMNIKNGNYDRATLPALGAPSERLVKRLQQTPFFSVGSVGPPAPPKAQRGWGPISDGERDLRRLLQQPDAPLALETLLRTGNWPGRLYGLLGLRTVAAPDQFRGFYQSFPANAAVARVLEGCLMDEKPAHNVAEEINRGVWDNYLKRARSVKEK